MDMALGFSDDNSKYDDLVCLHYKFLISYVKSSEQHTFILM